MDKVLISDEIMKVLDKICEKIGLSINWTQDNITPQVLDLLHRLTKYEIYTSLFWIGLGILLLVFSVLGIKYGLKNEDSEEGAISFVAGCIISFISVIMIGSQIHDIITALTIPELIWMDYIKSYMN